MQAQQITGQPSTKRFLEVVASVLLIAILVVGFIVANLGLGFEGRVTHGPVPAPAPIALEADRP